jgi:hypothetical protein
MSLRPDCFHRFNDAYEFYIKQGGSQGKKWDAVERKSTWRREVVEYLQEGKHVVYAENADLVIHPAVRMPHVTNP